MIFPLASEGGCQLMMMVRGLFSLLTTVTSLGEELGTETGRPLRMTRTCRPPAAAVTKRLFHLERSVHTHTEHTFSGTDPFFYWI